MNPWVLDLCSGLGGASEAFVKDPYWDVVRIENNPELAHVPHTESLDVLQWMDWIPCLFDAMGKPDLVIAAPPCKEFSRAFSAPGPCAERLGIRFEPDMRILEACIDIVEYLNPTYHIIENVQGAIGHFQVYLGNYRQHIGPFYLWGSFPQINLPAGFEHSKYENDTWSSDPLRANKRACWPIAMSLGLQDAVMQQSTLADWI